MSTTPVVPSAETSPSSPSQPSVSNWTPEQRQEWRKTGQAPKPESAPSPESKESDSGEKPATIAPASEPGTRQEHKKQTAAERLTELLDDLKRAGLSPSELKTFKREAQRAERQEAAPVPEKKSEAKVEAKPRLEDKKEDGTAKYKNYQEWEDAKDEWVANEAVRKADASREKQTREASQKEQQGKAERVWLERVAETRKNIADFDDVTSFAKNPDHPIFALPQGSALEVFIYETAEHGPEILHHLMADEAEYKRIVSLADRKSFDREMWKLDFSFAKSERSEKKAPVEPKTNALPPVREVGGRGTGSDDSLVSAALASKGKLTSEFKNEANRRALAGFSRRG